jgi:hypothetical protein
MIGSSHSLCSDIPPVGGDGGGMGRILGISPSFLRVATCRELVELFIVCASECEELSLLCGVNEYVYIYKTVDSSTQFRGEVFCLLCMILLYTHHPRALASCHQSEHCIPHIHVFQRRRTKTNLVSYRIAHCKEFANERGCQQYSVRQCITDSSTWYNMYNMYVCLLYE